MPILAFAHLKGGVGKSTCSISVACELHSRGLRTLLVDADHTTRGTTMWGQIAAQAQNDVPNVVSVPEMQYVPKLAIDYDWTVVDTRPASLDGSNQLDDKLFLTMLWVADYIAVPILPGPFEIWNMGAMTQLMKRAMGTKPNLRVGVFLNTLEHRSIESRDAEQAIRELGLPVLPSLHRLPKFYRRSIRNGIGPGQLDPTSEATKEIKKLTDEIIRHVEASDSADTFDAPTAAAS